MNLTENFRKTNLPGYDCRITTFRNCLAHRGVALSNSMMLGLSGCLMFCFNDDERYAKGPFFIICGINDQSLEGLSTRLNCYLVRGRASIEGDLVQQLQPLFTQGIPVNIGVNYMQLKNLVSVDKSFPQILNDINTRFHYSTLTGYDDQTDSFDMIDTDSSVLLKVPRKDLEEIWFFDQKYRDAERDPSYSCDGQWYSVQVGHINDKQLITAAIDAIKKVTMNFFHSPLNDIIGIEALKNFQSFALSWKDGIEDPEKFFRSIQFTSMMETSMSGGGFGRKLYGYFLNELSEMKKDEDLKDVSYLFNETAREWNRFIRSILNHTRYESEGVVIDYVGLGETVDRYIHSIVEKEINQMGQLSDWAKRYAAA